VIVSATLQDPARRLEASVGIDLPFGITVVNLSVHTVENIAQRGRKSGLPAREGKGVVCPAGRVVSPAEG
jgi:hypothetical protein